MTHAKPARRAALLIASVTVGATLAVVGAPGASATDPFTPETLVVPGNSISGVDTTQSLEAGSMYRAVAWGTFVYGIKQTGDAECTQDKSPFNPVRNLEPPLPAWVRNRFAFFGSPVPTPQNRIDLLDTDLRDPDPTDDPIDLYIGNRNVEWVPVPAGGSTGTSPNALGCHTGDPDTTPHVYEYFFVPTRTGPVNFRVFDVFYADNGAPGPNGENTLNVFVSEVAGTGLSAARHVETVLVSVENAGADSQPLAAGRRFALVAHGMWSYNSLYDLADAECARTRTDPVYERDRFGGADRGELWINGAGVDWIPVVPAQAWARTTPPFAPVTATITENCDAVTHYYRTELVGQGQPLHLELTDPDALGAPRGHLSVDVYEIDHRP